MSQSDDAYAEVLRDLKLKRLELDKAIASLERLQQSGANYLYSEQGAPIHSEPAYISETRMDRWLQHKGLKEGIVAVLRAAGRPLSNAEILERLRAGGLHFRAADPPLAIAQVLSRVSRASGEITKLGRGTWSVE